MSDFFLPDLPKYDIEEHFLEQLREFEKSSSQTSGEEMKEMIEISLRMLTLEWVQKQLEERWKSVSEIERPEFKL